MSKHPYLRWSAFLLLVFLPLWVRAGSFVRASINNDNWNQAENLGRDPDAAVLYGRLSGTSDARYYYFHVSHPSRLQVTVEVAQEAMRVEPRVVLYSPEQMTIGPALPMPQPAKTIALVYPANAAEIHVEGPLRTTMSKRIDQPMDLPAAGQYYLAVYNAGHDAGAFRMTVGSKPSSEWPWSIRMRSWWLANIWLGPQYGALTLPLLIAVAALVAWLVVRRVPQPLPARKLRSKTKRTIVRGRIS